MHFGSLLDAVHSLTWPSRERVTGARAGTHVSRLRGRAPELSEYRLYRQGDDPRDLDWKLLARSDRPFVRLSDDRATHATWFLIDASASMDFPEGARAKWDCACAVTVGLASIAQRAGDPVSVVAPGTLVRIAPTTRRDVVTMIAQALQSITPTASEPLAPALAQVAPASRVVIVSDLLGDEEAVRRAAMRHTVQGGEVIVVHVLSQEELTLDPRLSLVQDPEWPAVLRSVDVVSVHQYAEALNRWLNLVSSAWIALGATYVRVVAEEEPAVAVRSVIEAVRRARAG